MKNLFFSLLNSNEVQTAATRINEIILGNIADDPFISKVQPLLKPSLIDLSLAHGRTTDSSHVKLLRDKDLIRDTRFIALRDFSKAFLTDADATMFDAAIILVNIFKELGWTMYNEGFAVESALLQALFERFDNAPASDAIITLGATAKFADLKTAQADFENTYKNKVDAKAKEEYPKIQDCRKAIARYLGAILTYIDLMTEIEGGVFKTTAGKIDEVITEFEAMARNRQTRKITEKTKTETGNIK